jgi:MFS family permease
VSFLLTSFLASAPLQAEEPKNSIEDRLRSILPQDSNGTKIEDSQLIWAYAAAVVGFLVVFSLAWFLVRVFAFLVIVVCFVGGICLVCAAVHFHQVTTWQQLAAIVVGVGVVAGVTAITANLYLLKGGVNGEKKAA